MFVLSINRESDGINLTVPPNNTTLFAIYTAGQATEDLPWTKTAIAKDDGDVTLEAGELAELTVDVSGITPQLTATDSFTMEVKPKNGSWLVFERTLPASIDKINGLK